MTPATTTLLLALFYTLNWPLVSPISLISHRIREQVPKGTVVVDLVKLFDLSLTKDTYLAIGNRGLPGVRYFDINQKTGNLVIREPPDRDSLCKQKPECDIQLSILYGSPEEPSHSTITIFLDDINDNAPSFPQNETTVYVIENTNPGDTKMDLIQAQDPDLYENSVKIYKLEGDTYPFKLQRDKNGARLTLTEQLDREHRQNYTLRVLAIDNGTPPLTGTLTVHVVVRDVNDNRPTFKRQAYDIVVKENAPVGKHVLTVEATDPDYGSNGRLYYYLRPPINDNERLANRFFEVRTVNKTGRLVVRERLDVDSTNTGKLDFTIEASDGGSPPLKSSTRISIRIQDVNDDRPKVFIYYIRGNGQSWGYLQENEERRMIAQVTVTDRDTGLGGEVSCRTNDDRFRLQDLYSAQNSYSSPQSSRIYRLMAAKPINRETTREVQFNVICVDNVQKSGEGIQLTGSATVRVKITDVNDENPRFIKNHFEFSLPEGEPTMGSQQRFVLGRVEADDRDEDDNAKLTYSLITNPRNYFEIEPGTGTLYAVHPFDREEDKHVDLIVQATDSGKKLQLSSTANVRVIITDKNDSPPHFTEPTYFLTVEENLQHALVGKVTAKDFDDGNDHGKIIYKLERSADADLFAIDAHSGTLRVKKELDREIRSHYEFRVFAIDNPYQRSEERNTGTTSVAVTVIDQNDNAPVFQEPHDNQEFLIDSKMSMAGITIFTARATDPDQGTNSTVNYSLDFGGKGIFEMDATMGICYLREALTENSPNTFTLRIRAYDLGRPRSLNTSISVRIVRSQTNSANEGGEHSLYRTGQVSDRTIIIILITIFILLLLSTVILVALIRYRHIFSRTTRGYLQGRKAAGNRRNKSSDDPTKSMDIYRKYPHPMSPTSPSLIRVDNGDVELRCKDDGAHETLLPSNWNQQIVGSFLKLADIDANDPGNAERMVLANRQHSQATTTDYQTLDGLLPSSAGVGSQAGVGVDFAGSGGCSDSGVSGMCISNAHTMTPGRENRRNYYYELTRTGTPLARRGLTTMHSVGGGGGGNIYQVYGSTSAESSPLHQVPGDSSSCKRLPATNKLYVFEGGSPAMSLKTKKAGCGYTEDSFV